MSNSARVGFQCAFVGVQLFLLSDDSDLIIAVRIISCIYNCYQSIYIPVSAILYLEYHINLANNETNKSTGRIIWKQIQGMRTASGITKGEGLCGEKDIKISHVGIIFCTTPPSCSSLSEGIVHVFYKSD